MFINYRRVKKWHFLRLVSMCCVMSILMVCWEQVDHHVVSHVKSYSYRYLINSYGFINKSLSVSPEEAARFGSFPYLLNNKGVCTDKDVLLLLFVKSSPGNFKRRQAIRSTWGDESYVSRELGVLVKVVFAMGANPDVFTNKSLLKDLQKEHVNHGDLVQQDFLDTFHNLTVKLLLQFHWTHENCAHARFLMTADDDVFIHMPNLVHYLQDLRRRNVRNLWVGHVHRGAPPIRRRDSKYYMPFDMYQWSSYPDYTAGAGYVVSGDVAAKIYQAMLSLNASMHIDDVFMGVCAIAAGVSPQEHVYFSGEGKTPYHPCIYEKMITSHGHEDDIRYLWKVATSPQVEGISSGLVGKVYCTAVKMMLLCKPYFTNTYSCMGAFT
ncbi:lactosylceramide 1,3-N-acetyl-beta-D-glucosaminyltransferase A [Rhinichthys klamathensis goyatoka]|uniref:lactosylceramide 1,3-N-acetyl-beta-D-glucosaminyltransferase A n=1 Tax=Rhinichthys klamathensis goyatoka TaxID=3034132 RepID=UPI0024B5D79A|nr:lactosylceramide 1,3-N-acetyl-beta-D-glucosaminyltransferase A [Rhinichthys klamathensis goyatoka]